MKPGTTVRSGWRRRAARGRISSAVAMIRRLARAPSTLSPGKAQELEIAVLVGGMDVEDGHIGPERRHGAQALAAIGADHGPDAQRLRQVAPP
jgi:hypothetical protein